MAARPTEPAMAAEARRRSIKSSWNFFIFGEELCPWGNGTRRSASYLDSSRASIE
jgi:hypothetical protein